MKLFAIFTLLALCCFVYDTEGRIYYRLDEFRQFIEILLEVPNNIPTAYDWWTPYYAGDSTFGPPPSIGFTTTSGALGGETDLVLGYESTSNPGVSATLSTRPVGRNGGCFYTLGFVGGGYWQWDGPDQGAQFPGAANAFPGLGSSTTFAYLPQMNNDGQSIDITLGGRVIAFTWEALTDLDCDYEWDFFDRNNASSKYRIPIAQSGIYLPYIIDFDSTLPVRRDAGWLGFDSVAAIQLTVYTFVSETNAVDTEFRNFTFVGYQVEGNVIEDCDCDQLNGSPGFEVQGATVTLRTGTGTTPGGSVIATATTDIDGYFEFPGLDDGTYQVCINTIPNSATLCTGETTCRPFTLSNFEDPFFISFTVVQPATLEAPPDADLECDECSDATIECTGIAQLTSCDTGNTGVSTHNDVVTTIDVCRSRITRTFTSGSLTAVQIITIDDTQGPTLAIGASPDSAECNSSSLTFSNWLSTYGGATWSDCSDFNVLNGNPIEPVGCDSVQVTFTAVDICGNSGDSTQATFTVTDTQNPSFDVSPSDDSTECNTNGSDFTALNQWLLNDGGAIASDNCGSVSVSNDYTNGDIVRGCDESVIVTFTASDDCGRSSFELATFTIEDTTAPRITTQAGDVTDTCDEDTNTRFFSWLNSNGNAVATDTCATITAASWSNNFGGLSFPTGCTASVDVIFTVSDGCNEVATTEATYTVNDTTAPRIIDQPQPLSVSCDDPTANTQISNWLSNNAFATAIDDCTSNVEWSNDFSDLDTICGGTSVTFTVCDLCATQNCRSVQVAFNIEDNEAPTYTTLPQSITSPCDDSTSDRFNTWLNNGANAVLDDNCDASNIQFTNNNSGPAPFGCGAQRTVTFFAVDSCNNPANPVTATFTVVDDVDPVLTNPANTITVECDNTINSQYNTWRNDRGGARATDDCATSVTWSDNGPSTVSAPTSGCSNSFTVTFTAFDGCGGDVSTQASFIIQDTARPRITREAQTQQVECTGTGGQSNIQSWLDSNGGATAVDDCSSISWTNNFIAFDGDCENSATVTFTARDVCGLSATTIATYTIRDTTAPVINPLAQPFTSECGPNTNSEFVDWVNNHGGAVAADVCQPLASLVWTDDVGDILLATCGRRTVVFTVTDPCGRSASTSATFTVSDITPPTVSSPASDAVVECMSTGNQADFNAWVGTRGGFVATDSCALSLTYRNNAPTVGPSRCDSVTVTFTVEDDCNNSVSSTATFTVQDSRNPVFTHFPLTRVVECSDEVTDQEALNAWLTNFAGAAALDTCTASNELLYTATPVDSEGNSCFSTEVYRFTITDSCGNSITDTAAFILADITDPFFVSQPQNATFICDGNGNVDEIQNWLNTNGGGGIGQDECQGTVEWRNNYIGTGPFTCTSNLITFIISDSCGNSAASTVLLTILDEEPPVFSNVPPDVTVRCDVDTHPDFLGYPSATDSCNGNPIVTFEDFESEDPPIGDCPGNRYLLRTFSSFDECGNTATVDQLITINTTRTAGPCDPEGCVCDDCCPEASPSNCLPSFCEATPCRATPCTASTCLCPVVAKSANAIESADDLPQCEPIYIYVHDDDDNEPADDAALREPKMLVTNRLIDFKSDGSIITISFFLLSILFFLF